MPSSNLIVYVLLIGVGLHTAWRGLRGLRGQESARYGVLTGALVGQLSADAREKADRKTLLIGSIVRLVMGVVVAGVGAYLLITGQAL